MDTLKIALLAPEFLPNWGGAGTYSILLARELSKTDEIHVFTTIRNGTGDKIKTKRDIEMYFNDRVKIHIISEAKDRFFYNGIYQLNIARRLPKIIKKGNFDIIHSNHAHMPDLGLKMKTYAHKSITTVHTTLSSQYHGIKDSGGKGKIMESSEKMVKFNYPFLKVMERYYLNRCDHLICVSDFIREEVASIIRNNNANIKVIKNGVDTRHFEIKDANKKENDTINILYCGRLLALKGLASLIDAFAIVNKKRPDTHLTIVGGGDVDYWKGLVKLNGISLKAVTFTGQIDYIDMPKTLHKADIFVLPSMSESMPLSLLEAMSTGLACIASEVGGIPEIIENRQNGFLTPPGNSAALAKSIAFLIENEDLRMEAGKRAAAHIRQNFRIDDMIRKTREEFLRVSNG